MLVCPSWELDVENQALETRMLPRRNTGVFFFEILASYIWVLMTMKTLVENFVLGGRTSNIQLRAQIWRASYLCQVRSSDRRRFSEFLDLPLSIG